MWHLCFSAKIENENGLLVIKSSSTGNIKYFATTLFVEFVTDMKKYTLNIYLSLSLFEFKNQVVIVINGYT